MINSTVISFTILTNSRFSDACATQDTCANERGVKKGKERRFI